MGELAFRGARTSVAAPACATAARSANLQQCDGQSTQHKAAQQRLCTHALQHTSAPLSKRVAPRRGRARRPARRRPPGYGSHVASTAPPAAQAAGPKHTPREPAGRTHPKAQRQEHQADSLAAVVARPGGEVRGLLSSCVQTCAVCVCGAWTRGQVTWHRYPRYHHHHRRRSHHHHHAVVKCGAAPPAAQATWPASRHGGAGHLVIARAASLHLAPSPPTAKVMVRKGKRARIQPLDCCMNVVCAPAADLA